MAKFTFEEDFKGFDADAGWQMIPEGQTQTVKLVEGSDDLEIRVVPDTPDGLEKYRGKYVNPTERLLPLHGKKNGSYQVQAVDKSGRIQAQLLVDVVKVLTLRIAYYLLPRSPKWNTRELHDAANKIWSDQAGVELVWLGEWPSDSGEALPNAEANKPRARNDPAFLHRPVADLDDSETKAVLLGYGNHSQAGLMVYFVLSELKDANGMTAGSQTIIDSLKRKMDTEKQIMVSTLAHEIGHRVSSVRGHDDKQSDLMFNGSPHGNRLRKTRILNVARGL